MNAIASIHPIIEQTCMRYMPGEFSRVADRSTWRFNPEAERFERVEYTATLKSAVNIVYGPGGQVLSRREVHGEAAS